MNINSNAAVALRLCNWHPKNVFDSQPAFLLSSIIFYLNGKRVFRFKKTKKKQSKTVPIYLLDPKFGWECFKINDQYLPFGSNEVWLVVIDTSCACGNRQR